MSNREIVVLSAVRTAIGTFGGSLKDVPPTELGALVVRESISRAGLQGKDIGHVVFGHVVNTEPKDAYLSRYAAIEGGAPIETPAFNVNRLCGSGLQAIVSASQSLLLGDTDFAIGAGAENMSRAPYASLNARWGARMGDTKLVDMMVGALHDPFKVVHMGVTAENIAAKWGISREDQDALALESHQRAEKAVKGGYFKDQIVPVVTKSRKGDVVFDTDEHFRAGASLEDFAKLKPVFQKENGTVTAGNASGINDGAAAVIVMRKEEAQKRGLKPLATIKAYAATGVEPEIMGLGPVGAVQATLQKAGWQLADVDLIEANEAFAAQALGVAQGLGLNMEKVNVNGGAIALGHPIGASGCRILVTLLHEMQRRDAKKGIATLCVGGGMGLAIAVERS